MTEKPDTPTSAAIFIAGLASSAAQMTDDELLSQINAHDPLDAEAAEVAIAIAAALERLDASLFTNAEHQQAKDILRGALKRDTEQRKS